jgi:hypothetical protein
MCSSRSFCGIPCGEGGGGRTPSQAIGDPDGREIVKSLLLDWERQADEGAYQPGIRPDFDAIRKLLNLPP